ncbi:MAG: sigma-70 family RNA polymerase sigma factor [Clostridia bacterium]
MKTDEELALLAQQGNSGAEEELLQRYKTLVKQICRGYFLVGAEVEDLLQEGMIGVHNACLNFKKGNSFGAFARICITRRIQTAVKSANRQKHIALNSSISFNTPTKSGEDEMINFLLNENEVSAIDKLEIKERNLEMQAKIIKLLSSFEQEVLTQFLLGHDYQIIAKTLLKTPKSIDNALNRIKNKLTNK